MNIFIYKQIPVIRKILNIWSDNQAGRLKRVLYVDLKLSFRTVTFVKIRTSVLFRSPTNITVTFITDQFSDYYSNEVPSLFPTAQRGIWFVCLVWQQSAENQFIITQDKLNLQILTSQKQEPSIVCCFFSSMFDLLSQGRQLTQQLFYLQINPQIILLFKHFCHKKQKRPSRSFVY